MITITITGAQKCQLTRTSIQRHMQQAPKKPSTDMTKAMTPRMIINVALLTIIPEMLTPIESSSSCEDDGSIAEKISAIACWSTLAIMPNISIRSPASCTWQQRSDTSQLLSVPVLIAHLTTCLSNMEWLYGWTGRRMFHSSNENKKRSQCNKTV